MYSFYLLPSRFIKIWLTHDYSTTYNDYTTFRRLITESEGWQLDVARQLKNLVDMSAAVMFVVYSHYALLGN
jgi:hypothetical protein